MSDSVRCPTCGASNAAGAEWCGQCFARFDSAMPATPAAGTPPAPAAEPPAPRLELVQSGPIVRTKGQLQWTCPACGTQNGIDASACTVCQTPMAALFGATTTQPVKRTGPAVVALSVMLPGLGHGWAGRIGEALARGVLFCWTLGVGILLLTRKGARAAGTFRGVGAMFVIAAIAVWIVSLVEAQRLARGDASALVPSRVFMWGSAALTGVLFLGLAVATQTR